MNQKQRTSQMNPVRGILFLTALALCIGLTQACETSTTPTNETPQTDAGDTGGDKTSTTPDQVEPTATPDRSPDGVPETPKEETPTTYSFPGELVPCKVNQSFEALKPILSGGKNTPTGRGEQSGVYDPCNGRVVVFGGNDYQPEQCADFGPKRFKGDTWIYVLKYENWVRLKTDKAPSARGRQAFTLDLSRKKIYIFGGRFRAEASTGNYTNYNDLWAFDLNTDQWEEIKTSGTAPSPRTNTAMVYDDLNDRLILFGGNASTSGLSFQALNDTYILDLKTNTWSRVTTSPTPSARLFHAMVMDGKHKQVLMYGGGGNNAFVGPFINDVWAFDLDNKSWKRVWVPIQGETIPPARINPMLIEDRAKGKVLMFAGHDDTAIGHRNDLWVLDTRLFRWQLKQKGDTGTGAGCASFCRCAPDFVEVDKNAPERRQYHTFVSQIGQRKAILFGGKTDCGYIDDTWYLDIDTYQWEKVNDASKGEACKRTGRANCKELCY